ncbi:MAG TPA: SIMPL domain-containing protein [Symbiobacteriaceae bacterium]|nr:SIMPL domain-containing protein [Symbiobacteriaceae bacterium]
MDSGKHSWSLVTAALLLGLSIVIGTVIVTRTIQYVKTFNTSLLTATGSAEQLVTADVVKWTGSFFVDTSGASLQTGYAKMEKSKAAVCDFLTQNGVPDGAVTIAPMVMNQNYVDCKINPQACANGPSYRLIQTVIVESNDVPKITSVAGDLGSLIRQDVTFSTHSLEYFYSKLPELRAQLLAAATKDAQQRAEQIALSTGGSVGQLVSLTTQPLQLTPVNSDQSSNSGTYDTSTIEKKLTAIVQASFRLPQ